MGHFYPLNPQTKFSHAHILSVGNPVLHGSPSFGAICPCTFIVHTKSKGFFVTLVPRKRFDVKRHVGMLQGKFEVTDCGSIYVLTGISLRNIHCLYIRNKIIIDIVMVTIFNIIIMRLAPGTPDFPSPQKTTYDLI